MKKKIDVNLRKFTLITFIIPYQLRIFVWELFVSRWAFARNHMKRIKSKLKPIKNVTRSVHVDEN